MHPSSKSKFREHSQVVLTTELPALRLLPGAVGVIIHVHEPGDAYEVELMSEDGHTIGIATLQADALHAKAEATH